MTRAVGYQGPMVIGCLTGTVSNFNILLSLPSFWLICHDDICFVLLYLLYRLAVGWDVTAPFDSSPLCPSGRNFARMYLP